MYKLTNNSTSIIRLADGATIPADKSNSDYQAYLIWVKDSTPFPADTPSLSELKNAFILKIDVDVDAIYASVVGNRFVEYQDASIEAKAFKDNGYTGEAGSSITSWASVKGQSLKWAADDILATAAAWKIVQSNLRMLRLTHKEQSRVSVSKSQLETVQTSWQSALVSIKTMLGLT